MNIRKNILDFVSSVKNDRDNIRGGSVFHQTQNNDMIRINDFKKSMCYFIILLTLLFVIHLE